MQPLAVDYPPNDVDCNVIANTGIPFGAAFGDDLFNLCTIPAGWYAVPVTQPQYGSVSFASNNEGWQYTGGSTLPSSNTPDPFTYRLTDGNGNYSNTATITPLILVEV